ncbi:MAG: hypothetical protein GY822_22780 [Deltaproteobacteria bacterium]|nr:hypothetical protein [Deltaproteobacteria bacterium]
MQSDFSCSQRESALLKRSKKEGISLTSDGLCLQLCFGENDADAQVLLPESCGLDAKAVDQLARLAGVHHPKGGRVCQVAATPDF